MINKHIPQGVKNIYHFLIAIIANVVYGFPAKKLNIIGVTGTDGKTTTSSLIYEILKKSGVKVALVTTVSARINKKSIDTGFHVTSPGPLVLQKLIKEALDSGCTHMVLEATSHGLSQHRFWGIPFNIGILTNITHEHLDYHKTFPNYIKAKSKLLTSAKTVILNRDDATYKIIENLCDGKKIVTYGINSKADFNAKNILFTKSGMKFTLVTATEDYLIKTKLVGNYNCSNILAAVTTCTELNINSKLIINSLREFNGVEGRMEEVNVGQPFKVYVDFAHTPNSLQNVLSTLKKRLPKNAKLIVVFGCAGERDYQKRPIMAKISTQIADISVFTAEDPRNEDLNQILNQMTKGVDKPTLKKKMLVIPDRKKAIYKALEIARDNDIVIVCGKGHEKSMAFGNKEKKWSDKGVIGEILNEIKSIK